MTKKQVEFVNKTGLHARPASDFVLEAKKYESKITKAEYGRGPEYECNDSSGTEDAG